MISLYKLIGGEGSSARAETDHCANRCGFELWARLRRTGRFERVKCELMLCDQCSHMSFKLSVSLALLVELLL
jgi:hypothetical protein